ncbi:MAG: type IV pilus modification protein PilV [Pseudomonadota bacterium]|uniref:type IV pilus modification protein PilV n=1 Tax=Acinetobacter ursingii TaxID=108980 RepID=UPI002EC4E13A|nr:type IV pilus modification protein PilV [Pseudomonadota bacterium]
MYKNFQTGVGLIEVLVALLLLAIGVLGFSVLQVRAVDASQEASDRSVAMNLARDLAERIRINKTGLAKYKDYINANPKTVETGCIGSATNYLPNCNPEAMVKFDVGEILTKADSLGQTIKIYNCVGSNLNCIYVAWGRTNTTTNNINTDASKCIDSSTGTYLVGSQCLVMEAF